MSNKYGSTWWGQQWLNAFSNIDVSNRLPHGRSYANTGKVHSVEVTENKITAKVQGSRPNPYRVEIIVPLFSKPEKQDLISEVARNPALVARLLHRELPPDVMEYAENHGINIFPKTWKDFEMKCSCPDWAVPCNHLSAVIYTLAEEIDKNPFLAFEVHGLDLVKELEGRNVRIADKKPERTTSAASLLLHSRSTITDLLPPMPKPARAQLFKTANDETPQPEALDFTALPDLDANLLALFRPSLVFFDKDFKEAVQKIYAGSGRAARKLLDGDFVAQKLAYTVEPEDRLQLVFDENLLLKNLLVWDKKGTPKPLKEFRPEHLVQILLGWDLEMLRCTHPGTSALLDAFNFSLTLAKNGAMMPQLLEGAPGTFRIRWLPAVIAEEVRAVFEKIAASLPPDLLTVQTGKEERRQSQGEMLNTLCSVFIGTCMADSLSEDPHPLAQMFQFTTENKPESFDSEDTAQMLQVWLNNFYLAHKDYVPLLKVVDEGNHFSVELLVEDRRDAQRPPVPLSQVLKQKQYESVKLDVLKDVMRAMEFFPQLHRIVESQGERRLTFSPVGFVDVLLKNLPVLRLFGAGISLPDGMEQFVRPQASLLVKKAHGKKENPSPGFAEQLAFGWQVALGDDLIPIDEFETLVINLVGIVKMRGRYVLVDEDELVELFQKFDEPPRIGDMEALQAVLAGEYGDVKIGLTAEAEALVQQFLQPAETPLPQGLRARLRPYQRTGYGWLLKNAHLGFGSLLADGMGLGKTLQAIAALLRFKEEGLLKKDKALVIVPAPLLANWRREMEKFAPTLTAAVYFGQRRKLDVSDPDIIITTYGVADSEVDLLKKMSWHCIVIDEAQHIKNANSELSKNVKSIPAVVRIALISMSMESRLSECWSILDFTNRGWLGSSKRFTDTFAKP
ncbi:MAG: hypothetical protein HY842_03695, partial [Bacteroidetes bacterium]|nr:hypothetical protein [Bacteroidota bacterium]